MDKPFFRSAVMLPEIQSLDTKSYPIQSVPLPQRLLGNRDLQDKWTQEQPYLHQPPPHRGMLPATTNIHLQTHGRVLLFWLYFLLPKLANRHYSLTSWQILFLNLREADAKLSPQLESPSKYNLTKSTAETHQVWARVSLSPKCAVQTLFSF